MTGTIDQLVAWEALDSRGRPTVACDVRLRGGASASAIVPAGASTGRHEAVELRDGGARHGGWGVRRAVDHVNHVLAPGVAGHSAMDQPALDATLRALDGSPDLSRLGANAILSVSLACALAAAKEAGVPLYRWLAGAGAGARGAGASAAGARGAGARGAGSPGAGGLATGARQPVLPLPMVNIFSGGAHAGGAVDVQDVLFVPVGADSVAQAIEWTAAVRAAAAKRLDADGHDAVMVADEGGLAAPLRSNRAAVELVARAIEDAGLEPGDQGAIALDVAASELLDDVGEGGAPGAAARGDRDSTYRLAVEQRALTGAELVAELREWARRYPLVSIEDPVGEDDAEGWDAARSLTGVQVVGDDLFATHPDRVAEGIDRGWGSAVLVKANQNGTLSGAMSVIEQARDAGYAAVVSARSGETEDVWLADLATGTAAGQLKVGSTTRSERTAKWNRLLRIEAVLDPSIPFAGRTALVTVT
jgi:enolase 1/2/3